MGLPHAEPLVPAGEPEGHVDAERRLLDALRQGSRAALEEVYARHKGAVLALAAGMLGLGGRDGGAWDVLHDVFVGLARAASGLRPDCNVRAYLLRAAANQARDRLARRRTRDAYAVRVARHLEPPNPSPDPACSAAQREQLAALWDALTRLPDEQRTVVAARLLGEQGFLDIAAAEGIALNTAHSRYRYGIQKLRREFGLDPQTGGEVSS